MSRATVTNRSLQFGLLLMGLLLIGMSWVSAPTFADDATSETTIFESAITDSDRAHWSFRPLVSPPLPMVNESGGLRTFCDAFVLKKLEQKGLSYAPAAARATLLRRLAFDLSGLPPTSEELLAFEENQAPDAYEREVDRRLASPSGGERWGQFWLDLARFAETDGFEHDLVRPQAWKYRDWVIAALNADLPYDQFVGWQIAGDETAGKEAEGTETDRQTATMFCLAGPDMPDVNDQFERRHHRLNELTATVGSVFLGLQFGCAQCHDHKYDPLSQADFYRLRAIFEPAVPVLKRDTPCLDLRARSDTAPARLWIRGDHRRPGPLVQSGVPRIACAPPSDASLSTSDKPRLELARWLFREDQPLTARVIANRLWQIHFGRGLCETPSDLGVMGTAPTHPQLLDALAIDLRSHAWSLKHLHRVIVCSQAYRQASRIESASPSVDESAAWRARCDADAANQLYSRFPRQRLDGELLRDAMLAASGLLNRDRGGPGVMPPLPEDLLATLLKGQWTKSPREADHYRRSIYLFARRNLRYPIFEAFDRPDANASCPVRSRSTSALQSLILFNSEFALLAARHLAGRVLVESTQPSAQVEQLYFFAYGRRPKPEEVLALTTFLEQQRARLAASAVSQDALALPANGPETADPYGAAALVDASLALLNSSEFLYVD